MGKSSDQVDENGFTAAELDRRPAKPLPETLRTGPQPVQPTRSLRTVDQNAIARITQRKRLAGVRHTAKAAASVARRFTQAEVEAQYGRGAAELYQTDRTKCTAGFILWNALCQQPRRTKGDGQHGLRIYGLVDPRDEGVRYIGVTKHDLAKRLEGHLAAPTNNATHAWFGDLKASGLVPLIRLISWASRRDWHALERHWIKFCRQRALLLNVEDGGVKGFTPGRKKRRHPWAPKPAKKSKARLRHNGPLAHGRDLMEVIELRRLRDRIDREE